LIEMWCHDGTSCWFYSCWLLFGRIDLHVFVLHHVAEIIYADAGQNPHGYSSN
jgi:hypothetical protein